MRSFYVFVATLCLAICGLLFLLVYIFIKNQHFIFLTRAIGIFVTCVVVAVTGNFLRFVRRIVLPAPEYGEDCLRFRPKPSSDCAYLQDFTKKSDTRITGSKAVDNELNAIIENIIRDYVLTWYSKISKNEEFPTHLKKTLRDMLVKHSSLLKDMDVNELASGILSEACLSHTSIYRKALGRARTTVANHEANTKMTLEEKNKMLLEKVESYFFELDREHRFVLESTTEDACLHQVCELVLLNIMPENDFRNPAIRSVCTDVLVNAVMKPLINRISDPDYVNLTICQQLTDFPKKFTRVLDFVRTCNNPALLTHLLSRHEQKREKVEAQLRTVQARRAEYEKSQREQGTGTSWKRTSFRKLIKRDSTASHENLSVEDSNNNYVLACNDTDKNLQSQQQSGDKTGSEASFLKRSSMKIKRQLSLDNSLCTISMQDRDSFVDAAKSDPHENTTPINSNRSRKRSSKEQLSTVIPRSSKSEINVRSSKSDSNVTDNTLLIANNPDNTDVDASSINSTPTTQKKKIHLRSRSNLNLTTLSLEDFTGAASTDQLKGSKSGEDNNKDKGKGGSIFDLQFLESESDDTFSRTALQAELNRLKVIKRHIQRRCAYIVQQKRASRNSAEVIEILGAPSKKSLRGNTKDTITLKASEVTLVDVLLYDPYLCILIDLLDRSETVEGLNTLRFWMIADTFRNLVHDDPNIPVEEIQEDGLRIVQDFLEKRKHAISKDSIDKALKMLRETPSPHCFDQLQQEAYNYLRYSVFDDFRKINKGQLLHDLDFLEECKKFRSDSSSLHPQLNFELSHRETLFARRKGSSAEKAIPETTGTSSQAIEELDEFHSDFKKIPGTFAGRKSGKDSVVSIEMTWAAKVTGKEIHYDRKVDPTVFYVIDVTMTDGIGDICWKVLRRYSDFHDFHMRLQALDVDVPQFPGKKTFGNMKPTFLAARLKALDDYLQELLAMLYVMKDIDMEGAIGSFLSHGMYTQEYSDVAKKIYSVRSTFTDLIPFVGSRDSSTFLSKPVRGLEANKDIAGNDETEKNMQIRIILGIVDEILDFTSQTSNVMRKRFVLMARHMVERYMGSFVESQITESLFEFLSSSHIALYINNFRESFWPNGVLAEASSPRTQKEKTYTRREAHIKLLVSVSDETKRLIGGDLSRAGMERLFTIFQSHHLNKRLVYNILEIFLGQAHPELNLDENISCIIDNVTPINKTLW